MRLQLSNFEKFCAVDGGGGVVADLSDVARAHPIVAGETAEATGPRG